MEPRGHLNRWRRGRDFISDLPDHLLHRILVCLKSVPAAARTSVLSRRWRRVWEDLPELVFGEEGDEYENDVISAALEAYSAPTVHSLDITVKDQIVPLPDASLDAWLHFGSQRVTGKFVIDDYDLNRYSRSIDLPLFERTNIIDINILSDETLLRFRSAGTFAELTNLYIETTLMEARELEALVSSHCPRLRKFNVSTKLFVSDLDDITSGFPKDFNIVPNVSIRSRSLNRLIINLENVQRLDIATPMLQAISSDTMYDAAFISAPALAEVSVSRMHLYDFTDVGHHLRYLNIERSSVIHMGKFHTVDKLTLEANRESDQYNRFLAEINNLPKCEILTVYSTERDHGFVPCMLQILRKANGTRKFVIERCLVWEDSNCLLTCPCRLPETSNADITFASLEEIKVKHFKEGDNRLEFLELLLSRCMAPKLTRLKITMAFPWTPVPSKKLVEKLQSICPLNVRLTITQKKKLVHISE